MGPQMYTDAADKAVILAVAEIAALVDTDMSIRNKETLTKAASPILRAVGKVYPEIWDTEPRGWIANRLDEICQKNGWACNEWENYDW